MDTLPDLTFRQLAADETELICPLLLELAHHHNAVSVDFAGVFPLVSPDRELPHIRGQIEKGEAQADGCFANGALVAFSVASQEFELGSVDLVYVSPRFRRRGIAKRLVLESLDYLKSNGVRLIDITVAHGNTEAKVLYEKLGFRLRSEILCMQV